MAYTKHMLRERLDLTIQGSKNWNTNKTSDSFRVNLERVTSKAIMNSRIIVETAKPTNSLADKRLAFYKAYFFS